MKKLIETMAALAVAFVLVGTMVGCGQAVPDQGEVDTTTDSTEDMEKQMKDAAEKSQSDQKGGGGGTPPGGGGTPPGGGGTPPGGGGTPPSGGGTPPTPNP